MDILDQRGHLQVPTRPKPKRPGGKSQNRLVQFEEAGRTVRRNLGRKRQRTLRGREGGRGDIDSSQLLFKPFFYAGLTIQLRGVGGYISLGYGMVGSRWVEVRNGHGG